MTPSASRPRSCLLRPDETLVALAGERRQRAPLQQEFEESATDHRRYPHGSGSVRPPVAAPTATTPGCPAGKQVPYGGGERPGRVRAALRGRRGDQRAVHIHGPGRRTGGLGLDGLLAQPLVLPVRRLQPVEQRGDAVGEFGARRLEAFRDAGNEVALAARWPKPSTPTATFSRRITCVPPHRRTSCGSVWGRCCPSACAGPGIAASVVPAVSWLAGFTCRSMTDRCGHQRRLRERNSTSAAMAFSARSTDPVFLPGQDRQLSTR